MGIVVGAPFAGASTGATADHALPSCHRPVERGGRGQNFPGTSDVKEGGAPSLKKCLFGITFDSRTDHLN